MLQWTAMPAGRFRCPATPQRRGNDGCGAHACSDGLGNASPQASWTGTAAGIWIGNTPVPASAGSGQASVLEAEAMTGCIGRCKVAGVARHNTAMVGWRCVRDHAHSRTRHVVRMMH